MKNFLFKRLIFFRKGDIDDPIDCFNMLNASCKHTDCEDLLYDLMIRLLLISDRKYKRCTYFTMIKMCVQEIVFGDGGYGPEFENKKVIFERPLGKFFIIF